MDLGQQCEYWCTAADQFLTGRVVGSSKRTVKLAPIADAWGKELSPEEQNQVSDALLAASALDDFKNTGTLSSLNLARDGASATPVDLDNLVRDVRAIQSSTSTLRLFSSHTEISSSTS
jgi:hypothetical protein